MPQGGDPKSPQAIANPALLQVCKTICQSPSTGLTPSGTLVRRSTLEDVFLRLTGRTLVD